MMLRPIVLALNERLCILRHLSRVLENPVDIALIENSCIFILLVYDLGEELVL